MAEKSPARIFPATVALLSCIYHFVIAVSCVYLPDDLLYLRWAVQLYALEAGVCSLVGLWGIVRSDPTKVKAFSLCLFIDTLVAAFARLLLLQPFVEAFNDRTACSSSYNPTWSPRNFRYGVVTSIWSHEEDLWDSRHGKRCQVALGAIHAVLIGLLVCLTAAQGTLAFEMRRFGKELELNHRRDIQRKQRLHGMSKPRRSPELSIESEKVRLELA